jgi:hypothetical protein
MPGTLFEMSTSYQILNTNKDNKPDIEADYRFWKKRDISKIS